MAQSLTARQAIAEGLADMTVIGDVKPDPKSTTFRIVITTQVYENYEYRWKAKGGNEYHIAVGSALDVIALGSEGLNRLATEALPLIQHRSEMFEEFALGWSLMGDQEETWEEEMDRECPDPWNARRKEYRENGWRKPKSGLA